MCISGSPVWASQEFPGFIAFGDGAPSPAPHKLAPPHMDMAGGVNTGSFLYCEQKCEHKQLHCPYLLPSLPLNKLGEHWATSWDLAQPPLQSG